MRSKAKLLVAGLTLLAVFPGAGICADVSLFFLHHSTGRNIINDGDVRQRISDLGELRGIQFNFWDHDYNYIGLTDFDGNNLNRNFGIPGDNTNPDGLHTLWTTANSARDSILNNYQVIAFKSCFPACDITSTEMLEQYKNWYNGMRLVFDAYPEKIFIIVSPPPRHRLATNVNNADRAREFANWLGGEFLEGHSNLHFLDLFSILAKADDGTETRNMLRYEYERSHTQSDSHPNTDGNIQAGQELAEALAAAGTVPLQSTTIGGIKAMYR